MKPLLALLVLICLLVLVFVRGDMPGHRHYRTNGTITRALIYDQNTHRLRELPVRDGECLTCKRWGHEAN